MSKHVLLDEARRADLAAALPDWLVVADGLERTFEFRNFNEAFGFMTRVALAAERHDHHPEWRNVWRTVHVRWSTHDAGGLTELDVAMARRCDQLAA